MKTLHLVCTIVGLTLLSTSCSIFSKSKSKDNSLAKNVANSTSAVQHDADKLFAAELQSHRKMAFEFAKKNGYSTQYCFLVDMGISSGKYRFFVYDLRGDTIALSGLVAHGGCNNHFVEQTKFSNAPSCGCSSLGKYKIGTSYHGEFGKSYRLYGLDSTNSNALKRAIVLHGYDPIPDQEIYPTVLCNSYGCPMVSRSFLDKLSALIDRSEKPILLWVYQ
jgi:hypothetical protein